MLIRKSLNKLAYGVVLNRSIDLILPAAPSIQVPGADRDGDTTAFYEDTLLANIDRKTLRC